ncbi:hypothetical protein NUU61_000455 [Penicillium alfredii]|uniref:Palmitoyltransferase n=1 Tax=Penicillium alfredii TaxID=1506179 RepID=A0A9W9G9U4_9EURO|nr:uncharacterized protein NUU61_000455 [Penicillium alfredii]KAJ5114696.1 hypothetical protein NUU61_000455 [Penicillium alfredii]
MAKTDRPNTSDTNQSLGYQQELGIPRPPSVGGISSRVTDLASEDGEQSPSFTSPPPPLQQRPSVSRRGPPPTRNSVTASSQTNRPGSSGSRLSRTHIPSLAAQAFFRPMSSQRLQAHRGGRPMTKGTVSSTDDWNDQASQNRRSLISNGTLPQGSIPPAEMEVPPSRGTEFTDPIISDRNTSNASPTGETTIRSLGESVRLLRDRDQSHQPHPGRLNLSANYNAQNAQDTPPKSPLSLFVNAEQEYRAQGSRYPSRSSVLGWFFAVAPRHEERAFPQRAPWLWHNISPAIPILFAYVFYVCFSSFVHASVVDPGIMPRNVHPMPPADPSDDPLTLGPPTNDWVMVKLATSDVAAMDVPVKYCKTCNIWRPPRCYHCRVCDNCVETLDHHCVWLNNCVGRRNYRYFFAFVSSCTILALFLIGASLAHILVYMSREGVSFGAAISKWRVPWAMVIYGVVAVPYPTSLWAYHLFLVGRGETTREYLNSHKFAKSDRHRPFTQGNVVKNWLTVFGRPRPPTYMQFNRPYEEGDQRLATQKRKYRVPDVEAQAGIEMQHVGPRQG